MNTKQMIEKIRLLSKERDSDYVTDDEILFFMQTAYDDIYYEIVEENTFFFTDKVQLPVDEERKINLRDIFKVKLIRRSDTNERIFPRGFTASAEPFLGGHYGGDFGQSEASENYYQAYEKNGVLFLIFPEYLKNIPMDIYYVPSPKRFLSISARADLDRDIQAKQIELEALTVEKEKKAKQEEIDALMGSVPQLEPGWENYIIYYAASEILDSEMLDSSAMRSKASAWKIRVIQLSTKKTRDFPAEIVDMDSVYENSYYERY